MIAQVIGQAPRSLCEDVILRLRFCWAAASLSPLSLPPLIFVLSLVIVATAWAQPKGLDYSVVVANEGANSLGTVATFAKGARRNAAPEFLTETPADLSELFSGLAVSPVTQENFVVDFEAGVLRIFSPNSNGLSGPVGIIDIGGNPAGVAFDSMADPMVDTTGQIYVTNQELSEISVYDGPEGGSGTPNLIIQDFNDFNVYGLTGLASPMGLFVDEASVTVCVGSATSAVELCDPANGNTIVTVLTRRIWVVNAAGYVTVYAPDLANSPVVSELLGELSGLPRGNPCAADQVTCEEPPLGGFFATSSDPSDDTIPTYIAVNSGESRAYISDLEGGFKHRGRIKSFRLFQAAVCIVHTTAANDGPCELAIQNYELGAPIGSSIAGPHTQIDFPEGISVAPAPGGGDELFITNFNGNSVLEFDAAAVAKGADVAPAVYLKGPRSGLAQPIGVAVTPPIGIPSTTSP